MTNKKGTIGKEIIVPGIILMIITIISGLSLAYINELTQPIIKEQKEQNLKQSLTMVIPEADSFEEQGDIYLAKDVNGNVLGKIFNVKAPGYSSTIEMLVGIDSSEKITNLVILSQQETPGLGTRIEEDSFISQFKGKTLSEAKLKRDGGKIDGITGATISSSAVANNIASISDSNIKQVEE